MSADEASEIARLGQENERRRMERDFSIDLCRNADMGFCINRPTATHLSSPGDVSVLEVSPAGYNAWHGSARATANSVVVAEILQVHRESASPGDAVPSAAASND